MKKRRLIKSICSVILFSLVIFVIINYNNSIKKINDSSKNQTQSLEEKIVDHEFILRVSENDLSYENLKKIYSPKEITKEAPKSELDKKNNGMLLVFKTDTKDIIRFFKTDYTISNDSMVFTSNRMIIDKDIKIGTEKSLLEKKLGKTFNTDKIIVTNIDEQIYMIFFFNQNKLTKVTYNSNYLD